MKQRAEQGADYWVRPGGGLEGTRPFVFFLSAFVTSFTPLLTCFPLAAVVHHIKISEY